MKSQTQSVFAKNLHPWLFSFVFRNGAGHVELLFRSSPVAELEPAPDDADESARISGVDRERLVVTIFRLFELVFDQMKVAANSFRVRRIARAFVQHFFNLRR